MNIHEYLKNNILLFDGAMGTYIASFRKQYVGTPEEAVLEAPDLVESIHRQYLENGSKAIKTDSFAANRVNFGDKAKELIEKAYDIAVKAAQDYDAFVFADIGPMDYEESAQKVADEYIWIVDTFLKKGATNFIFETQSNPYGVFEATEYIKKVKPEAYIIISYAILPDGYTLDGQFAASLITDTANSPCIDAVGMNCAQSAAHILETLTKVSNINKPLTVMPNAGYPYVVNHRTVYKGSPSFYAQNMTKAIKLGAKIIGGCCGTTPAHIAEIHKVLVSGIQNLTVENEKKQEVLEADLVVSKFWEKLNNKEKVIAVELDPPETASSEKFMNGASNLKKAGIDILTIADCPIGRARMDSSILACKVSSELNLEAIPHLTCRDRNLNATKALLLGLYSQGIRNVLLVTGDPIPSAKRDEVKSVYQFNSRKLASFVINLAKESFPSPVHIFGAININALNFDVQLKLAKDKLESGMVGFLTQPVLSKQALENLKLARQELKDCFILGGLIPIVSERNARFMDSEINGINVSEELIKAYEGKSKEECEQLAISITSQIAKEMSDYVDGYYIITPFQRTKLISRIIEQIKVQ